MSGIATYAIGILAIIIVLVIIGIDIVRTFNNQ